MYVIYDARSRRYFARRPGDGWYTENILEARMYKSVKAAERVIAAKGHHVDYPGDRELSILPFTMP